MTGQPHEASLLMLDSTKARQLLGWQSRWDVDATLARTADWYRTYYERGRLLTDEQIDVYGACLSGEDDA
jgi:CDP-glucose 4,6-dehydratase